MEKLDILPSFQDIFTKIGENVCPCLSHRLAKVIFQFLVCVFISWFIGGHHDLGLMLRLAKVEFKFLVCVHQLVH